MAEDLETEIQENEVPVEEATAETPDDDMQKPVFNKIQVADVVKREKQKAYERGKREAMAELQAQQPQQAPVEQIQQGQQSLGGMQQLSPQDIQRMIAEQAPQLLQEHLQKQMHQVKQDQAIESFVNKMQAAEVKYPGLEEKLNDLDYTSLAPLVQMANDMDNTADIMKELVDNPEKLSSLTLLSYTQPKLAQRKMADLSKSIQTNQEALAQEKQAQDPMSQLKPSTNAGMDNGSMSVSDFRKMFRG